MSHDAPLRLIAVTHYPPMPGGSARSCALLFREIARRGHPTTVLGAGPPEAAVHDRERRGLDPEALRVERFPISHYDLNPFRVENLLAYQEREHAAIRATLPGLVDRVRPSLVVAAHETMGAPVVEIAHAKGLPCALMLRGTPTWQIVDGRYPEDHTQRFLDLYAAADLVVPVGRYMQDALADRTPAPFHHIPTPLDLERFSPGPRDARWLEARGIPGDAIVVLHASVMTPRKHPAEVLESAALALPRDARLHYLFCGGQERTAELRELAHRLGVAERVHFVEHVEYERMPEVIRAADMVVLGSEGEGVARVYVETQACARVMISSDIPAAREVIEHERTGLLFETGSPSELAEQVLRAAGDAELRRRIGAAGRERARVHDVERVVDAYVEAWSELAAAAGGGALADAAATTA